MASSAGLFLISTLGPLVDINILVLNSVRDLVTVSRVTPTTWAISSWVKVKLKRTPFGVSYPWTADSNRKQAIFSVAEGVRPR